MSFGRGTPCNCGQCTPCLAARTEANTTANRYSPYESYFDISTISRFSPTYPTPPKRRTIPLPPTTPLHALPAELPIHEETANEDAAVWILRAGQPNPPQQMREAWSDQPTLTSLPVAPNARSGTLPLSLASRVHRKSDSAPPVMEVGSSGISRRWSSTTADIKWGCPPFPEHQTLSAPTQRIHATPQLPPRLEIHPLLNGNGHASGFLMNLSLSEFTAGRNSASQSLTTAELRQQAFNPPVSSVILTCKRIPQWPMVIPYRKEKKQHHVSRSEPIAIQATPTSPGLTVEDVLRSIGAHLRTQISKQEWESVSAEDKYWISHAYRSRTAGNQAEEQKGLRRCDFLLVDFMFHSIAWDVDGFGKPIGLLLTTTHSKRVTLTL